MSKPASYSNNMSKSTLVMIASLMTIALLKLLLIANHEIVSEADDPLNYVSQADNLGTSFGMRATGYSTWLWVGKVFGFPQRIAIEILWLVSVTFLALSVVPPERSRWLALPFFTVAAFTPQTYYLFDRALTEGFYLCLSALALGCSVRVFRQESLRRRAGTLVAMGMLLGIMAITRNEAALLLIFLVAWSVSVGLFDWICRRFTFASSCFRALGVLAVVSVSAAVVPTALALHNGWAFGVFTPNVSVLPSNMKLLKTLAEIETEEPNFRFVPITRKAREMAYSQSPTFARFREVVEDPKNVFQSMSLKRLGRPGEIGAGWIWHVFNLAAFSVGITNYIDLDATYLQAVREIEEGFASGKYRRRFVLHPFLGGNMAVWMPYLSESVKTVVDLAITPIRSEGDANLQPSDLAIFDRVCMRRLPLVFTSIHIHGWVFSKNKDFPISGVTVEEPPNNPSGLRALGPRPDVQKAFQREGFVLPEGMDFDISESIRKQMPDVALSFLSGTEVVGQINQFEVGKVHTIAGTHGDIILGIEVVNIALPREINPIRERVETTIRDISISSNVWIVGLALSAVCLLVLAFFKRCEIGCIWLATAGVFFTWSVIHLGFYALLNAAAWEADGRYLQNSAFFGIFFIVTAVIATGDHLARLFIARLKLQ